MTKVRRVAVFYSPGPHFFRAIDRLRADHPECSLAVIVPPSFPADELQAVVDEVVTMERNRYSFRSIPALYRLVRQIRFGRFDVFVILFDSIKLRLIAHSSGSASRYCYSVDGRLTPIRFTLFRDIVATGVRRIRGHLTYLYIRKIVYSRPVKKD